MFIKEFKEQLDLWSYVHWIGTAYITATEGLWIALVCAVGWECLDMAWSLIGPPIAPYTLKNDHLSKSQSLSVWIDRVLDRRGFSYVDLIMCILGVSTTYLHQVHWTFGLLSAVAVFAFVEKNR